jgi:hypothetical protein
MYVFLDIFLPYIPADTQTVRKGESYRERESWGIDLLFGDRMSSKQRENVKELWK